MELGENDILKINATYSDLLNRGIEENDAMTLAEMFVKTDKKRKGLTSPGTYMRSQGEWRAYHRNKKLLGESGIANQRKNQTKVNDIKAETLANQGEFQKNTLRSIGLGGRLLL